MRRCLVALVLTAELLPGVSARAQAPRDTPPPSIENARRARELEALVAGGTATKDTYLELVRVYRSQRRFGDLVLALGGAAALEPGVPQTQHMLGTIAWEVASREASDPADRLSLIRAGIAFETRALALKPDYLEAMTFKSILLRLQVNLSTDPVEQVRLLSEADALRDGAAQLQRQRQADNGPTSDAFGEQYAQTYARLTPVRVGGTITQPMKTRDVKPVYPADAQASGVQGVVIIEAIIDPSGSIANARVLRSIPPLDDAALGAVRRWQFMPTLLNGQPVAVMMTVTVNFTRQ